MQFLFQLLIDLLMLTGLLMIAVFALGKRPFIISLAVINLVIFSLTVVIYGQDLSVGSGLGLFAMFTLMRYRSKPLAAREMSFLLIAVCIGVLNAVFPNIFSIYQVLFLELILLAITLAAIKLIGINSKETIEYDRLELLKPEKKDLLYKDLEFRFDKTVTDVSIKSISFSKSCAELAVTFNGKKFARHKLNRDNLFSLQSDDKTKKVIPQGMY